MHLPLHLPPVFQLTPCLACSCRLSGLGTALPGDLSARQSHRAGLDTPIHRARTDRSWVLHSDVTADGRFWHQGSREAMGKAGVLVKALQFTETLSNCRGKHGGLLGGKRRTVPSSEKMQETEQIQGPEARRPRPPFHPSIFPSSLLLSLPASFSPLTGLLPLAVSTATSRPRCQLSSFVSYWARAPTNLVRTVSGKDSGRTGAM